MIKKTYNLYRKLKYKEYSRGYMGRYSNVLVSQLVMVKNKRGNYILTDFIQLDNMLME